MSERAPAGWYTVPKLGARYWDGQSWEDVHDRPAPGSRAIRNPVAGFGWSFTALVLAVSSAVLILTVPVLLLGVVAAVAAAGVAVSAGGIYVAWRARATSSWAGIIGGLLSAIVLIVALVYNPYFMGEPFPSL